MARRRKSGERYPSGKLKPNRPAIEPFSPALIQRIKRGAKARFEDPRLGSEVGMLLMLGELTAAQAAAAFRIASIYGLFEYHAGRRRSARSPSYDSAHGELLLDGVAQARRDQRERAAARAFEKLQKEIPHRLRAAVEQLAVEDRAINSLFYPELRRFLDQLAAKWRSEKGSGADAASGAAPPPTRGTPGGVSVDARSGREPARGLAAGAAGTASAGGGGLGGGDEGGTVGGRPHVPLHFNRHEGE